MYSMRRTRAVALSAAMVLLLGIVLAVAPGTSAAAQDAKPTVAITGVDANAGTVELTNHGDAEVDPNGIFLCNFPAYGAITGADVIPPGASITVETGASGVLLDAGSGELGLYATNDFESPDAMISYVEWGDAGHQRSSVAIAAGLWSEGVADATDGVLTASTDTPTSPADWGGGGAATEGGDDADSEDAATTQESGEEPAELATTGIEASTLAVLAGLSVLAGVGLLGLSRRARTA